MAWIDGLNYTREVLIQNIILYSYKRRLILCCLIRRKNLKYSPNHLAENKHKGDFFIV